MEYRNMTSNFARENAIEEVLGAEDPKSAWVFLDWSNIQIPAKDVARRFGETQSQQDVRVDVANLLDLALDGRKLAGGVAVGGPGLRCVRTRFERRGIEVVTSELGSETGTEQGVDETLQARMLLLPATQPPPATVVLLTGDGAGAHRGVGFIPTLRLLDQYGYGVEGLSWKAATNDKLAEWLGARHKLLDAHYPEITFVEGGRRSERRRRRPARRPAGCAPVMPERSTGGSVEAGEALRWTR